MVPDRKKYNKTRLWRQLKYIRYVEQTSGRHYIAYIAFNLILNLK